jgi:hypothetical protein
MADLRISIYIGQVLSGAQFKEFFPNLSKQLVKLTYYDEIHNKFQFKTGLNVDTKPFNPTGRCKPGGFYFTDLNNLPRWIFVNDWTKYYRYVDLPDDCRVYLESDNTFKADKFFLGEKDEIRNLPLWSDEDYCVNAASICTKGYIPHYYMRNFSDKVQLELIKKSGTFIDTLSKRDIKVSEEVQSMAVENNYNVIRYLLRGGAEVSEKIKLASVNNNYEAIYYLLFYKTHISEEVKNIAVEKSGITFENLVLNSHRCVIWGDNIFINQTDS